MCCILPIIIYYIYSHTLCQRHTYTHTYTMPRIFIKYYAYTNKSLMLNILTRNFPTIHILTHIMPRILPIIN